MLTGRADELVDGKLIGWAFNEDNPDEHLVIRVMFGQQVVGSGVANVERVDLVEAEIGKGDHAFHVTLAPHISSLDGLMVIAQSVRSGEAPLPIASSDDRKIDTLLHAFGERYDDALRHLKSEIDTLAEQVAEHQDQPGQSIDLPDDIADRLVAIESRLDAAEVFFLRIDETLRKLTVEKSQKKRKRLFGIF
jgi:hypothetical protein